MPLLEVTGLSARYGDVQVLHSVSLHVEAGEVVSIVGANGAGKTTLMRSISGLIDCDGGVRFDGAAIDGLEPHHIVRKGIAHVPEGRQLFTDMSVHENLLLGLQRGAAGGQRERGLELVHSIFPRLLERRTQITGTLSGGEQQMVAIARGLMLQPTLLMLDEPSLGLSPKLVEQMFHCIDRVNASGMAVLLVEQNLVKSLQHSQRGYVLETGRIALSGKACELLADERTRAAFFGLQTARQETFS